METFRLGTNVDKYTQGFKQILHDGKIKGGANWSINQKSQVITKFMLLEKIATTLGYPASDRFAEPRKPSKKLIHDKLASVVKAVSKWLPAYEAIHKHVTGGGSRTNVSLALPDPEHMSDVQLVELRQLTLLLNGSESQKEAEHLMVEGNLQYLAFMVHWHCTVGYAAISAYLSQSDVVLSSATSLSQQIKPIFLTSCYELAKIAASHNQRLTVSRK